MGFHTRGEMGGIWSPPIKLLDGLWFGIGDQWIGPAHGSRPAAATCAWRFPAPDGVKIERTDFVPGEARGVLVGLEFDRARAARVDLTSTRTPS